MAHAAAKTVVTVERIHDGDLLRDPLLAAGTLPGFYVEAVAVAPRGAWPLPLPDHYAVDGAHVAEYARLAATAEGFADVSCSATCISGPRSLHERAPPEEFP